MKLPHLLLSGVAAAILAVPVAVVAQTPPQAPVAAPHRHHGFGMRAFQNLNLTDQQKQQIQSLMQQFHQAHPRGSQPDPQARKALHEQIMNILTPQQQAQYKADMAQMRQQRRERQSAQPTPSPAV